MHKMKTKKYEKNKKRNDCKNQEGRNKNTRGIKKAHIFNRHTIPYHTT